MNDIAVAGLLIGALFLILGERRLDRPDAGGRGWVGMQLFSTRPAGDAMAVTIWGSARAGR